MLNKKNILNETSPVPRKLSSNCGIGVSLNYDEDIEELYIEDMERIYRKSDDNYSLYKDFDDDELLLPPDVNLLFVPLANAVPPAKAFPRLKILPFLSKASDCLWLNTIAFLGISTNSAPCVPTVHHLPV